MGANANDRDAAPIKAHDAAKTGRLGEECNEERHRSALVPFGLLQRVCVHSVNKP